MSTAPRHPAWIRVRAPGGPAWEATAGILARHRLTTVCREAACPNQAECWGHRTATFMLGGSVCTRGCRFCNVATAKHPPALDPDEPERIAAATAEMGMRFVVLTSVDRDDLPDGGAAHWAAAIRALRRRLPKVGIEALVPDFRGEVTLLDQVLDAGPDVLSHNLETVPRLYRRIRPGARYEWSLAILAHAARRGFATKTGLMLGFGERLSEVVATLEDAYAAGVRIVTLGQYLRPSPRHAPVAEYLPPERFEELARIARAIGFPVVEAGPFVRSSYHAHHHAEALRRLAGRGDAGLP